MKNLIKIVTLCSLLIFAGVLISSCGSGDAENFVQGNGQVDVTVRNSAGALLANVNIVVTNPGGTQIDSFTTTATGFHTFQLTVGTVYTFTFSSPGFATQSITREPLLTATVTVNPVMLP